MPPRSDKPQEDKIVYAIQSDGSPKEASILMCWKTVFNLTKLLFGMSRSELSEYIEKNKNNFTQAEYVLLKQMDDPILIWKLIERQIGYPLRSVSAEVKQMTHADILKEILETKNAKLNGSSS